MPRLFVAVFPPADVLAELGRLTVEDRRVRWVRDEQRHVTLRFFADAVPAEVAARLRATVLPRATAVLGPSVERLGAGAIVVPVAGLDDVAAAVRDAADDLDPPETRPFRGHLTIARLRDPAKSASARRPSVIGAPIVGTFEVTEVTVVESRLSSDGPTYSVVATFPTV